MPSEFKHVGDRAERQTRSTQLRDAAHHLRRKNRRAPEAHSAGSLRRQPAEVRELVLRRGLDL